VSLLGEGGMGQVYCGHDTKLNRDVALKILPEAFTLDGDRIARFRREAQVLASLNHPHIAHIYGFEDSDSTHAIVLELVEGPTLADRIAKGPLPLDEALPIARQIAEALEAAHEQGIIHRDLKPANIKVRDDGTVKVLDFGLAKALEPASALRPMTTAAPTITTPAQVTGVGMILGTAAYLSPEQAKGRPADRRSDVWAFGCVLFEMITGRRAFSGDDFSEVVANILKTEPDWNAGPQSMPRRVRRLLQRTLDKNPATRVSHASALRFELDEMLRGESESVAPIVPRRSRWVRALPAMTAALAGALALGIPLSYVGRPRLVSAPPVRLSIPIDTLTVGWESLAISSDGRRIAYVGGAHVYVRDLGSFDTTTVVESPEGQGFVMTPAFSPDGEWLAFYSISDGALKRVSIRGGTPITIMKSDDVANGIRWDGDDLLWMPSGRRIVRVSSRGGPPRTIVTLPADEEGYGPQMLPDGDHVLFTTHTRGAEWSTGRVIAQSLRSGERKVLVEGGQAARYVPSGHLVYAAGGGLFAVALDTARLEVKGAAMPVVDGVMIPGDLTGGSPGALFAVADTGTLVYIPGKTFTGSDIAVVGQDGVPKPLGLPSSTYKHIRVSPEGRRIAFTIEENNETAVYVYDLDGHTSPRRLTFGSNNRDPEWSADGTRLTFSSDRDQHPGLFSQRVDGTTAAERLTMAEPETIQSPESWSPHDEWLLYTVAHNEKLTLWTLSARDKTARRLNDVESSTPTGATFSPDGRWVAYATDNTLFVQPFPPTGARYQISKANGGHHPIWSKDGRQLWWEAGPGQLVAVPVVTQATFGFAAQVSTPAGRFGSVEPARARNRDLLPDGRWVTAVRPDADSTGSVNGRIATGREMHVVLNWFTELQQRVPTR
jgi:serine/threonine-protein kinase